LKNQTDGLGQRTRLRSCHRLPRVNILTFRSSLPRFAPLLCLLAGMVSVLAFAPFGLWPLQALALAFLFHLVLSAASLRRALLLGWAFGFGCFAFGVYWPYVSMHRYGDLSAPLATLAVALFSLLLGVFSGLAMVLGNWLRGRWQAGAMLSLLVIFPATWMLAEWLRDWIFTGFPWLAIGYAHTGAPLAGYAPLLGVFGVSWLAAMMAGGLALLPSERRALALIAAVLAIGVGLRHIAWTHAVGQPISVRLLQGNVPQEEKFQNAHLDETLAMYDTMLREKPADLIATPETAIAQLPQLLPPDYLPRLTVFAKQTQSHLALGIVLSDAPGIYTNSVVDLAPQLTHDNLYRYDKHHLVPFGEFIPAGFHWFVDLLNIPLGDQTSGPLPQAPFAVKDQWVLPNICYEDLFGEEIAADVAARYFDGTPQPTILLNQSNMGWFGQWLAVPQHLQISQMRALETGRTVLRATNTGATAIINPNGDVVAELAPYTRGTLAASAQGFSGLTPYILGGNTPAVVLAALALIAAGFYYRKKHSNRAQ
jgi:apolipoprotein N-acyltransferase